MADLLHGSDETDKSENPETIKRNTRYGLILFAVYLGLYSGFVLMNAFAPEIMETVSIAGINLAIIYGFILIISAFILALVYGWLCRNHVHGSNEGDNK